MTEQNGIFADIDTDLNLFNTLFPDLNDDRNCKYVNIQKFNESIRASCNDFSLLCWNCRSLYPKLDEISCTINELNCNFDIITFTESWLDDASKNMAQLLDYTSYHSLRNNNKRGGGVSTYISKHISSKIITNATVNHEDIETLFVELEKNGKRIILGTVYRPPSACQLSFLNELNNILALFNTPLYNDIIICGDFNYDLLKQVNCEQTTNFLNAMQSKSFVPIITKPTRVSPNSATLIYNIFMADPTDIITGILISDLSDHFPVFLVKKNVFTTYFMPQAEIYRYRCVNESNSRKMRNVLTELIPSMNVLQQDIDSTNID